MLRFHGKVRPPRHREWILPPVWRLMSRYSARVLDHFQNPRRVGHVTPRDGLGRPGDPDCGDFLEVSVRLSEDHRRLTAVGSLIKGCPAAIATASMMTELVDQRTVENPPPG